ncbi:GntR family transcriptional regulator [Lutimaribacter saemankumensis]|uniref:DNA-binding transcriptional regulator, GntR family n=1 Tax=Lutimaribacter saemankumensis TaxID=490829 RepID=A0A1G8SDG7_9RHOB|nr:GntR family transcriptional regulator [Lutimaribacter saemankumensis]SDJ26710.1 DNA-binding transcriptional regulator, GntR family [Lutimaribacter saemankumensis]
MAKEISKQLTEMIVRGTYRPGDRLDEQSLADQFSVSRTPVREAIVKLASAGLVQLRPRRSALVRRMSEAELSEAFEAMGEIEGLCASYAAQRLSEAQRLRLKALMQISEQACRDGDATQAQDMDNEFHELIHSGVRNWMITSVARETRLKVSPYSAIGFIFDSEVIDLSVPHKQHCAIADAILAGDAAAARSLMVEHVGHNYLTLQELLSQAQRHSGTSLFENEED